MPVTSEHRSANLKRGRSDDMVLRGYGLAPPVHGPGDLLSSLPNRLGCGQVDHHAESFAKPMQETQFAQPAAYFQHDHAAGCEFAGVEMTAEGLERIRSRAQSVYVDIAVRKD